MLQWQIPSWQFCLFVIVLFFNQGNAIKVQVPTGPLHRPFLDPQHSSPHIWPCSKAWVKDGAACLCPSMPLLSPLQALHKAVLTIDESGHDHSGAIPSEERHRFKHLTIKFNRPFLVIITDENANMPLFMGKMVNPM